MAGLVEELQREALDRTTLVSDLLRKAKAVASKLGREDAAGWVEHELDGYGDRAEIPAYRRVVTHPRYWNPYHGWSEILFSDPEDRAKAASWALCEAISQIEELLACDGKIAVPLPAEVVLRLSRGRFAPQKASLIIDRGDLVRVLDTVRTRVLEWGLALERAGVRGEGLSFSNQDREAAAHVTYNISGGTFAGNVGPMSGGTIKGTVHQVSPELRRGLEQLGDQVRALSAQMGLSPQKRSAIEAAALVVKEESARPTPDLTRTVTALSSMATIAEAAAGNIIAAGVADMAPRLIQGLRGLVGT